MREAAAVARQMGLSGVGEDMGPQAANVWKMLDDLAVTDAKAYGELAKASREELVRTAGYETCMQHERKRLLIYLFHHSSYLVLGFMLTE